MDILPKMGCLLRTQPMHFVKIVFFTKKHLYLTQVRAKIRNILYPPCVDYVLYIVDMPRKTDMGDG